MEEEIQRLIRQSYDRLADEYARRLFNELQEKPFDQQLLKRFATELVGQGDVCDMGCGPGQVARYLRDTGTTVFGLDLSPGMLEQARQLNPDISFREGNMLALDLQDSTLSGIAAFYAIVNIPEESLHLVFQEMKRVLKPGGLLLLAFHVGDEIIPVSDLWGRTISMDFFFRQPSAIRRHLEATGFVVEEVLEREPYAAAVEHQSRRAYIFARKPGSLPHRPINHRFAQA
jgi:SAM-dependent methyltransferase